MTQMISLASAQINYGHVFLIPIAQLLSISKHDGELAVGRSLCMIHSRSEWILGVYVYDIYAKIPLIREHRLKCIKHTKSVTTVKISPFRMHRHATPICLYSFVLYTCTSILNK